MIRKQTARSTGVAFLLLLFPFGILLFGCGSGNKVNADDPANAPRAAVVKVTRQTITSTLEIASEFQPYQEINVYAKVSGYIQKLDVNWGTHVAQGQLLAVLEIPELEQQLQLDEAAVKRSEQEVARANEELTRNESSYNVAHLTYDRLANVQKTQPELVAQEEIDEAQGKDLEASAGVSGAKDAVSGAQQALVGAKAELAKDQALFAYARITAPFDGVVTQINAYTGALLPAGTSSNKGDQALCRLSQNDLLRLVIPMPERAVPDVHTGEMVAVHVSTNNQSFQGKIVRYSDQIDTTTRTMYTEIDVPNQKFTLVPGMYATVQIPLHSVENALTVPIQAVEPTSEGHGTVLVVDQDHRIEKRDVDVGIQNATAVEILSGLKKDEVVIFGEQSQFKPGEMVAPEFVPSSELE